MGSIIEKIYLSDYFIPVVEGILVLTLVIAFIWFLDGVKKYAYWWHKDKNPCVAG